MKKAGRKSGKTYLNSSIKTYDFMKHLRISILASGISVLAAMACGCGNNGSSNADESKSMSDAVVETIMSRRSVRKYRPVPVGRDTMRTILECGINAPNGMNRQSWEIRVTDSREFIESVTAEFLKANPDAASDPSFVNMFRNAPTVAFIANDPSYEMSQIDCGLLGENMVLAAWSMGIGSCCLGGPARFMNSPQAAPYLKRLGFSDGYRLLYCIGFGYPDESPEAKPRDQDKIRFID